MQRASFSVSSLVLVAFCAPPFAAQLLGIKDPRGMAVAREAASSEWLARKLLVELAPKK